MNDVTDLGEFKAGKEESESHEATKEVMRATYERNRAVGMADTATESMKAHKYLIEDAQKALTYYRKHEGKETIRFFEGERAHFIARAKLWLQVVTKNLERHERWLCVLEQEGTSEEIAAQRVTVDTVRKDLEGALEIFKTL